MKSVKWLVWGRRGQAGGVALAIAGAVLWTGTPAGAAAVISVTPSTNLIDGEEVTVSLTDWGTLGTEPPQLDLIQCRTGAVDIGECEVAITNETIYFDLDGSGNATALYTVEVVPGVCDGANPCSLFALENSTNFGGPNATPGTRSASVEISFDPTATTTTTEPSSTTTSSTAPGGTTTSSTPPGAATSTTGSSTSSTTSTTSATGGSSKSTRAEATPASTSGATTSTIARQAAGPMVAGPVIPTGIGGPTTLPRTGVATQAVALLVFGVVLATGGSLVRRRALRSQV